MVRPAVGLSLRVQFAMQRCAFFCYVARLRLTIVRLRRGAHHAARLRMFIVGLRRDAHHVAWLCMFIAGLLRDANHATRLRVFIAGLLRDTNHAARPRMFIARLLRDANHAIRLRLTIAEPGALIRSIAGLGMRPRRADVGRRIAHAVSLSGKLLINRAHKFRHARLHTVLPRRIQRHLRRQQFRPGQAPLKPRLQRVRLQLQQ